MGPPDSLPAFRPTRLMRFLRIPILVGVLLLGFSISAVGVEDEAATLSSIRIEAPVYGTTVYGVVDVDTDVSKVAGIHEVRVLVNGKVVGVAHEPPYRVRWDTTVIPNTRYTIEARALGRTGNITGSEPIVVTVANPNHPPVLELVGSQTVEENQALSIRVQARDPDGVRDPIAVTVTNLPPWAIFDPAAGEIAGTPPFTEASTRQPAKVYGEVRIDVCDPEPLCDHEVITITVTDVNRAPLLQAPGTFVIREGETASIGWLGEDLDGDPVTWRADPLPPWATFDSSTKTITITPGFDVCSLDRPDASLRISLEVCDPQPLCASQAMMITIVNVNRPPVWEVVGRQRADEGYLIKCDVQACDPDGDAVALKIGSALPEGAILTDLGEGRGRLTWTPRSDQAGEYDVTLVATDDDLSASTTVPVAVREAVLTLSGTVVDESGGPAEGVIVKLSLGNRNIQEVMTDAAGRYRAENLRPGTYTIRPRYAQGHVFTPTVQHISSYGFEPRNRRVTLERGHDERNVDFIRIAPD